MPSVFYPWWLATSIPHSRATQRGWRGSGRADPGRRVDSGHSPPVRRPSDSERGGATATSGQRRSRRAPRCRLAAASRPSRSVTSGGKISSIRYMTLVNVPSRATARVARGTRPAVLAARLPSGGAASRRPTLPGSAWRHRRGSWAGSGSAPRQGAASRKTRGPRSTHAPSRGICEATRRETHPVTFKADSQPQPILSQQPDAVEQAEGIGHHPRPPGGIGVTHRVVALDPMLPLGQGHREAERIPGSTMVSASIRITASESSARSGRCWKRLPGRAPYSAGAGRCEGSITSAPAARAVRAVPSVQLSAITSTPIESRVIGHPRPAVLDRRPDISFLVGAAGMTNRNRTGRTGTSPRRRRPHGTPPS